MAQEKAICYECSEVITDPLCEECFQREVTQWIAGQSITSEKKKEVLHLINSTVKDVRLLPFANFFCIICYHKMHNMCSYCLMKQLYNTLSPYIPKDEMMLSFNYKIHDFGIQRT